MYTAMTSQLVRVRGAAAEAYWRLAKSGADDLPALVHESFLLLLADPYAFVHSAAVRALDGVTLPAEFTQRAIGSLWAWAITYGQSRSDDPLLSEVLARLLRVVSKTHGGLIDVQKQQTILSIVRKINATEAARFIDHNAYYLRGWSGLGKLLIDLLAEPEIDDYAVGNLLAELAEVDPNEILRISGDFPAAAKTRSYGGSDVTDEFAEILTAAELGRWRRTWPNFRATRFGDTTWDRPRKLRSEAREIATSIECAAAKSNAESVIDSTGHWRSLEEEIKKDDAENKNGAILISAYNSRIEANEAIAAVERGAASAEALTAPPTG